MDREAFRETFDVSRETLKLLDMYSETLAKWQRKINLVAPSTVAEVWQRHFADSAQLARLMPDRPGPHVDLGSGAGFPGLVLAILRAERFGGGEGEKTTLIESDTRKAAFLREVARIINIPVDIDARRIELHSNKGSFDSVNVVTARALAPLDRLLAYSSSFFSSDTIGIFPKGRSVEDEIEEAMKRFDFEYRLVPSMTDPEGRIVVVTRLGPKP